METCHCVSRCIASRSRSSIGTRRARRRCSSQSRAAACPPWACRPAANVERERARERRALARQLGQRPASMPPGVLVGRVVDACRPTRWRRGGRRAPSRSRPGERGDALRQNDAQQDRQRPQLGQREQLHVLIAAHERPEVLGVDGVVGELGERLDDLVDARQALVRAGLELRQQRGSTPGAAPTRPRGSGRGRRGSCRAATRRRA